MKYWETIAYEISRAGWRWGYVSAFQDGRKIYVVGAYRSDDERFIVRSDELLTAVLELERQICRFPRGVYPACARRIIRP